MSRVNAKLRRGERGYFHWCPACEEIHCLPDGWTFNKNTDAPTFSPSFRQSGVENLPEGASCHYNVTNGMLCFHPDSFRLADQTVPMPDIPEGAAERWGV